MLTEHDVFGIPELAKERQAFRNSAKTRAMMSIFPSTESGGTRWRWLLLGSLALNLFFVGAAGAVAIRYSGPVPLTTVARIDHSLASRLDHIAAALPPSDAALLRSQLRGEAVKLAAAQADLRLAQDDVRKSLRAQPFDPGAMRTAMAESRSAHDNVDQVLHDTIAAAAANMSVVGRTKLADWPAERHTAQAEH
jgi:uncharacterized membrane protein